MKKTTVLLFLSAVALTLTACAGPLLAAEATIVVNAQVPESPPSMSVTILQFTDGNPDNNPWTNSSEVSSLDFGRLTYLLKDNSNAGLFYSQNGFCVSIYATTFGKPYEITSTCTGVTSGQDSLPSGSFGLIPIYSETDEWKTPGGTVAQGSLPANAEVGAPGPAIKTNALIYSSEATGTARILQAYYSIPPFVAGGGEPYPGYTPIPLTQPPGNYAGTVTITLALK